MLHNNSIRKREQSEANSIRFFQWEKHADGCTLYQVKFGNTSLGRYLAACLCYQKTHTTLTTLGITVRALTINQLDSSNIITVQGLVEEPLDKMLQPPLHRSHTGLFPLNE